MTGVRETGQDVTALAARRSCRLHRMYQAASLPVDQLLMHTLPLEDINAGFDRLAKAEAVRQIITF